MRRVFAGVAALIALGSGAAVLQLKLAVQEKADRLEAIAARIHDDREAIRVLEAEWAYLTTPRALQEQSIRFLALMPPKATQVLADPNPIPFRPKGVEAGEDPGVLLPTAAKAADGKDKTRKDKGDSL